MTQITSTVDFERDGKQVGWLRVPHSVTRSAYGTVPVPIAVVGNGEGPRILLTAGNHGDEYEGQVVLTRLVQRLEADAVRGRIIVLPALNLPAAQAGARVSPLDGGNLNRVFPGDPHGGPTWKIADYVEHRLLPMVDVVADFHSGGGSLNYRPHASAHFSPDASRAHKERNLAAVKALGVPHVMVFERSPQPGGLPGAAMRQGVLSLGGEYGGMGALTRETVALVERAVERLLAFFGATGELPADPGDPRVLHVFGPSAYVYAPDAGVFEARAELGERVSAGDLCGHLWFPETPARPPLAVLFEGSGEVVCRRHPARVERGDCVAHLAAEIADTA